MEFQLEMNLVEGVGVSSSLPRSFGCCAVWRQSSVMSFHMVIMYLLNIFFGCSSLFSFNRQHISMGTKPKLKLFTIL
ncbi:hypothetical protein MTR67_009668, partial [Solanum verrucosum]